MSQPVWITPAGNLGTVAENSFFSLPLVAEDPNGGRVRYELIAGNLPEGVHVKEAINNGVLVAKVQGVPAETDFDITFKFVVRAYVGPIENRQLADRTFSITVSGQSAPEFITPAGSIGVFYEGSDVAAQIEFVDSDPSSVVTASIFSGSLPPGLTINNAGLISGIITPAPDAIVGYDGSPFDRYPFDFTSSSFNQNYQFTVKIFDGITLNFRTFSMLVVNRNTLTADTTQITTSTTLITADESSKITPYIYNYPENGYIGLYRSGNYFSYQFKGSTYNNGPVYYELVVNDSAFELPVDLQFNSYTGWLYGNIKDYGVTDLKFDFAIYVYDANDITNVSEEYYYTLEIIGSIENSVIWLNNSTTVTTDGSIDLGSIANGDISLLAINAINNTGESLQYRLKQGTYPALPGVYNKLPQGLSLLSSGEISGKVSFNTFALDGGTTTFDEKLPGELVQTPTTFDMVYRFTVEAYSSNGLVSVFQLFSIRVVRVFNEPYNSLYIQAMPPQNDRNLLNQLLQNQDVMKPDLIFRQNDPFYGVARNVIYTHLYSINNTQLEDYVSAMNLNHFRKKLTLGEIKVAQALDDNDNVIYEVVYSEVVDDAVNSQGQGPGQSVPVPYPFVYNGSYVNQVYPNSLIEMRNQLIQEVGNIPRVLPLWMRSKQANGKVLGFVKCWIIAYTKPGKGNNLAYNIRENYGDQLNQIDFIADRYELEIPYGVSWVNGEPLPSWDTSQNQWEPGQNQWVPKSYDRTTQKTQSSTTFDIEPYYSAAPISAGGNYRIGDNIKILGSSLGGVDGDNDLYLTVTEVTVQGRVLSANYYGTVNRMVEINTEFTNVAAVTVTGAGTGAIFDVIVLLADGATTFDSNSLRFNIPADKYGLTDKYNKYLLFPKTNILG